MRLSLVLVAFFFVGCTQEITILERGEPTKKTVSMFTRTAEIVLREVPDPTVRVSQDSCSYSGFCMNCGLKFSGDFECGFGFYVNCSGSHEVKYTTKTQTLQTHYYPDKTTELVSPEWSRVVRDNILSIGACN